MNLNQPRNVEDASRAISRFQRFTLFFVILSITPNISMEPINPVKLVFLVGGAIATLVLVFPFRRFQKILVIKPLFFILALFIAIMAISALLNSIGVTRGVYGEWGRNTSLLFYFSLTILLLTAFLSSTLEHTKLFGRTLFLATTLNLIYMLIQYFNRDPIDWSVLQTIGFTGNLNFASNLTSIFCLLILGQLLDSQKNYLMKTLGISLLMIALFLVFKSGSLQGIVQFTMGSIVLILFIQNKSKLLKRHAKFIVTFAFLVTGLASCASSIPSFLNGIIFQQTMSYRRDYWQAALSIIRENPLLGVGPDNYGNFYREYRSPSASVDIERQSNSAHSIPLDIGVGSGLFAMVLYLVVIGFIYLRILRVLESKFVSVQIKALSAIWISLQLQNFYGINQATTGLVTFVLGGMLAGLSFESIEESYERKSRVNRNFGPNNLKNTTTNELVSAGALIRGLIGLLTGLLIAIPNFVADSTYFVAKQRSDYSKMESIALSPYFGNQTLSEFLLEEIVIREVNAERGLALARKITRSYPRSGYAWRVIATLAITPDLERAEALAVYSRLDPAGARLVQGELGQKD
jgi:putative inorganic carbon (HCO3(-)) transporter